MGEYAYDKRGAETTVKLEKLKESARGVRNTDYAIGGYFAIQRKSGDRIFDKRNRGSHSVVQEAQFNNRYAEKEKILDSRESLRATVRSIVNSREAKSFLPGSSSSSFFSRQIGSTLDKQ